MKSYPHFKTKKIDSMKGYIEIQESDGRRITVRKDSVLAIQEGLRPKDKSCIWLVENIKEIIVNKPT